MDHSLLLRKDHDSPGKWSVSPTVLLCQKWTRSEHSGLLAWVQSESQLLEESTTFFLDDWTGLVQRWWWWSLSLGRSYGHQKLVGRTCSLFFPNSWPWRYPEKHPRTYRCKRDTRQEKPWDTDSRRILRTLEKDLCLRLGQTIQGPFGLLADQYPPETTEKTPTCLEIPLHSYHWLSSKRLGWHSEERVDSSDKDQQSSGLCRSTTIFKHSQGSSRS